MRVLESCAHRLPAEPIRTTLRPRLYGRESAQLKPSLAVKAGGTAPLFAPFAAGGRDFCRHAHARAFNAFSRWPLRAPAVLHYARAGQSCGNALSLQREGATAGA